ncbi:MAG: hypothetical protein ABW139_15945 [Candidatus Thiodiazotropha sp. DIVDIV]
MPGMLLIAIVLVTERACYAGPHSLWEQYVGCGLPHHAESDLSEEITKNSPDFNLAFFYNALLREKERMKEQKTKH